MAYPKWVSPSRQTHLANLFVEYGNRCLLGHRVCPIKEHYTYIEQRLTHIAVAKREYCRDREGNYLRNAEGEPIQITLYKLEPVIVPVKSVSRLYDLKTKEAIKNWRADDRDKDTADWREELKRLHSLAERRYPIRGQFNNISKDIYFANQPLFYLLGLGVSGLTYKPFAKVRLASSYVNLYIDVDLGDTLKRVSKHKKRKARRYGSALPQDTQRVVEQLCRLAVKHYLDN